MTSLITKYTKLMNECERMIKYIEASLYKSENQNTACEYNRRNKHRDKRDIYKEILADLKETK